jgi:putative NADH-flavin reductase
MIGFHSAAGIHWKPHKETGHGHCSSGRQRTRGSEIVKELVARGHEVIAIARKPEAIPALPGVTAKAGDASDPAALAELIRVPTR